MKAGHFGLALSLVALAGCVTDPETGQQRLSNAGKGALAGSAGAALIGGAIGGGDGAIIGAALGAIAGGAVGSYMDRQERQLRERTRGTGIEVQRQGDEINLRLPAGVTFDFGSAMLKPEFRQPLGDVARTLNDFPATMVMIAGHTDSIGSDEANDRLSDQRARTVADFLSYEQVDPRRIAMRGYGKRFPLADNGSEAGRAQNRRVEIKLTPITDDDRGRRPGQPMR